MDEQQLPPPSSYPGAPRRRPSPEARAAAWLSGTVVLLSVLVMTVVGVTLTQLKQITKALETLAQLESMLS